MALTAQTFGQSPSLTYLRLDDPVVAYAVDEALAERIRQWQAQGTEAASEPAETVAPDSVYDDAEAA